MLNTFRKLILFLSLVSFQSVWAIPLEDIKDLDLTNEGYEDLNPLHGLVWNEGILENHGELLPEGNTLRKIILLLYHRTGTFDPSTQPDTNSVVPYLTPEVIGNINGALKRGNLEIDKIVKVPGGPQYAIPRKYRNNLGTWLNGLRNDPKAYRVMLALLWSKAQTKSDFERYYIGVRAFNPVAIKQIPKGWLNEKFTEKDAQSVQPPEIKHYDAFLYWRIKHASNAPPLEHQGDSFIPEKLSDCGETSLRNFLKLAIDQNGIYNVNVLKALGAKQNVIEFFTQFPTRQDQTTQTARDAWAKVTINLEHVVYKQDLSGKKFEIRASRTNAAGNMLAVLRALFSELRSAQNWEEVGQKIGKARERAKLGTLQIEETNLSTEGYGEVPFAVEGLGRFNWYFQAGHFYVGEIPSEGMQNYPKNDIEDIAVFYPISSLPRKDDTWFLYTQLRQNEKIEYVLNKLIVNRLPTINELVTFLNRLTTDDASARIFVWLVRKENIAELMAHKSFIPRAAYLDGLLGHFSYDVARQLASHRYFVEKGPYFIGHTSSVNSAMFSHDGLKVITASVDGTVRIWNAKTGELLRTHGDSFFPYPKPKSAAFSRDGSKILTTWDDDTVGIWNAETGQVIHALKGHVGKVNSASFNQDGTRVVTAGDDKTARIWNSENGELIFELKGHSLPVLSAVFSRDGAKVVTASEDKTARIWDAAKGKQLRILTGHSDQVKSAVFSPDDLRVLTASLDKTVRIWNAATGKEMKVINGISPMLSAAFNRYGEKVLTVSSDGKARTWSGTTGKEVRIYETTELVRSAVYSPDGTVLTTYRDPNDKVFRGILGTARIWH